MGEFYRIGMSSPGVRLKRLQIIARQRAAGLGLHPGVGARAARVGSRILF